MDSSQKLTDYERKRHENIRRNDAMIAALKIQSKAAELSASTKRQRVGIKSYKVNPEEKPKTQTKTKIKTQTRTPIVIRRSLRSRGMPPDYSDSTSLDAFMEPTANVAKSLTVSKPSPRDLGTLSMRDAYRGPESDKLLIERILGVSKKPHENYGDGNGGEFVKGECENGNCLELGSLSLNPENIARVVPGNAFPIFTSCYEGFIRLMDAEKEVFNLIYTSDVAIYSLSQRSDDVKCLYFSEGCGGLGVWDERTGKCSTRLNLHEDRINSIDFNSENSNIMATSSSDATACIWDLRSIDMNQPKPLKIVSHKRAVQSAYFSPSGSSLATTSTDNKVGILSGVNFEETSMLKHDNRTAYFRGIWGWDDSYIFIGSVKRRVDIISTAQRRTIFTLESPHVSIIPYRFDAHPYKVGMLAGATVICGHWAKKFSFLLHHRSQN